MACLRLYVECAELYTSMIYALRVEYSLFNLMFECCASRNVLLIVNTATRPTTPLRTIQTRRAFTSEVECRKCPILRGIAIRKFRLGRDVIYHAMTSPSSLSSTRRSQNNSKIDERHYIVETKF